MPPDRSPSVKPDIGVEILPQGQSADYRIIPHSKDGILYSHAAFATRQLRKFLSRHGG